MNFVPPERQKEAYNCPHCGAYSHQDWYDGCCYSKGNRHKDVLELDIAICYHCKEYSLWVGWDMVYPESTGVQPPNQDLDKEIQQDYLEAASIVDKSPRGAAALLRLAIQKLCKQLGERGDVVNDDIGNLVKKGLPIKIQRALDTVRVIGNESVHPGEINLNDNREIAFRLFDLVNIIAQIMITQPKEIDELYGVLPENQLEGIKKRDSK